MRLLRTFRALDADGRHLIIEATVLLGFAWVGLRTLSFATLRRSLDGYANRIGAGSRASLPRIGWAVNAVGRQFPAARTCLMEALAADVMLRRRGYRSELHFGVRKRTDSSQPLDAHAWVECDGEIVVGELDNLADYALQSAPERS